MRVICEVCHDTRFVTVSESAHRYDGPGTGSDMFPCYGCGPFTFDVEGKKYGRSGIRYGNPFLQEPRDYTIWRARNARKTTGWTKLPLFQAEEAEVRRLAGLYPGSTATKRIAWVIGQREVLTEVPDIEITAEEQVTIDRWLARGFSRVECLGWIEGQRYNPTKDEEYLVEARREFKRWRFLKNTEKKVETP